MSQPLSMMSLIAWQARVLGSSLATVVAKAGHALEIVQRGLLADSPMLGGMRG